MAYTPAPRDAVNQLRGVLHKAQEAVAARATTVESVEVGDVEVKNVVALIDLTTLDKNWDGIIGYTFMKDSE